MTRQAIVIGLGQYGLALAASLAQKGVEVLAVDNREANVRAAMPRVTQALVLDATDEEGLIRTNPASRDLCICAIGDDSREASIIVTALLRQLGAKRVIGRAIDPLHERILRLVGAHEVVHPEKQFGERFASRLLYSDIVDEIPLGHDLILTELKPPQSFVGRPLSALELPKRFKVTVVAVRRSDDEVVNTPDPMRPIQSGDLLIVVAPPGAVPRLLEKMS